MAVPCGEFKEVYHDGRAARFEWRISNSLAHPRHPSCCTPPVEYFNMIWRLEIHKPIILLLRQPVASGKLESVHFVMSCKRADGVEEELARNEMFPGRREYRFIYDFGHVLKGPCEFAIITCTLWMGYSPYSEIVSRVTQRKNASCTGGRIDEHHLKGVSRGTQTEGASCANCTNDEHVNPGVKDISILSEHFEDLLLSGDDHDFLIKVKGKQFRAHKCLLRARSPVFAAMFRAEMAESADDSVAIDDCDPDAFGELLRYAYTGKVDISSAGRAVGLYYAGDKYDFPRLKEMCVEFLKDSLADATIADVINLAARHDEEELLQKALVYLATHLEEVMLTVEWQRFVLDNPIQGNEMCIRALQTLKKR